MYKSYFTPEENQNCVMEPDALSVFKKEKNAPEESSSEDEDKEEDSLINLVKEDTEKENLYPS